MIKSTISKIGLLSALAIIAPTVQAQVEPKPVGSVSTVTLQLTDTFDVGALRKRDRKGTFEGKEKVEYNTWFATKGTNHVEYSEVGTAFQTYKFSTKEFLEVMVDEELIESITGWSIRAVRLTYEEKETAFPRELSYWLVNKDASLAPVNISNYVSVMMDGEAVKRSYSSVSTYANKDTLISRVVKDTASVKQFAAVEIDLGSTEDHTVKYELYGTATGSYTLKVVSVGSPAVKRPVYVDSASKIASISGIYTEYYHTDEIYFATVTEGSISISAGTPNGDLSAFTIVTDL